MSDNNPDKWLTLDESIAEDIDDNPELQAKFDEAGERVEVALKVYQLRTSYKLTRYKFGKIVGLTEDEVTKIERVNFTEPPNEVYELVCEKMNQWIDRRTRVTERLLPPQICTAMALKTNSALRGK